MIWPNNCRIGNQYFDRLFKRSVYHIYVLWIQPFFFHFYSSRMFKDGRGLRQQAGRRLPALWRMYRVRHMRSEWLLQTAVSPVSQVGRQRASMWVPVVNLSRTIVHKWFRYSPVTAFKSVSSTQHWFLFTGHWLLFKLYSLTLILPIAVACQMCHEHCNAN